MTTCISRICHNTKSPLNIMVLPWESKMNTQKWIHKNESFYTQSKFTKKFPKLSSGRKTINDGSCSCL